MFRKAVNNFGLQSKYKIDMPLFGAAYFAAPNNGTSIILCTFLQYFYNY